MRMYLMSVMWCCLWTCCLLGSVSCSSNSASGLEKKMKQKQKHSKPATSASVCNANLKKEYHPVEVSRYFITTRSKHSLASRTSLFDLQDQYRDECRNQTSSVSNNVFELKWRYQFLESAHCIYVELDLGNLTRFRQNLEFTHYRFSYRELTHDNNHLKRQPIEESVNRVILHRVHIRPYIVCVSFYKQSDFVNNVTVENSTESTSSEQEGQEQETTSVDADESCSNLNEFVLNDERLHDSDLCIDIDTQAHFLGIHEGSDHQLDRELVMVLFILCLLGGLLGIITMAHYIIEKPKKERMMRLMAIFHRRASHNTTQNNTNLNSMAGSHNSIGREKLGGGAGPQIMITNCSSRSSMNKEDSREFEPLLTHSAITEEQPIVISSNPNKVRFHVGETIIEEPPSMSDESHTLSADNKEMTDSNGGDAAAEENEACIKSISHLLDDKPWLASPSSTAQLSAGIRNESRSTLFATHNNDNVQN